MDSVFPECLGCGVTVAESATYCRKCSLAIKAHQHAVDGKSRLDEQAEQRRIAARDWPVEERGDASGQWHEQMAAAEFPLLSEEEKESVVERARKHAWLASQKAYRRSLSRVEKAG